MDSGCDAVPNIKGVWHAGTPRASHREPLGGCEPQAGEPMGGCELQASEALDGCEPQPGDDFARIGYLEGRFRQ